VFKKELNQLLRGYCVFVLFSLSKCLYITMFRSGRLLSTLSVADRLLCCVFALEKSEMNGFV
jgi:hypothetical protein